MKTIFEKIRDNEIPSYKIYEDDTYFAILDIHPKTKGHILLITKEPYQWVIDVPSMGEYFSLAQKIGKHIQEKLNATYISFQTFGIDVPHAHIHIVPFYEKTEHAERYIPQENELENLYQLLKM